LINTARDFRFAIWTLIALGGVMATLSVFQYLTGSFDQSFLGLAQARYMNIAFDYNDFRITGPFGDPNFFAQALVPMFALALERAWHESRTMPRVAAAIAAPIMALAVVFTFSRGALLALGVVCIAAVFTLRPSLRVLSLAGVALVLLLFLLPSDYITRATALFESDQTADLSTDPSVNQRTSILMSGLLMFADYPVAGIGVGNFPHRYLEYAEQVGIEQTRTTIEAHSFYVEIAAETGVIGLAVWGLVGFICFETIRAARRRLGAAGETDLRAMVTGYAIGLIGFFTAALFLHLAYARYMWILLAIVFALPKVVDSVVNRRPAVAAASGSAP
jgi:O-antigen ligase